MAQVVKPLGDYILVKRDAGEEISPGGIHLAPQAIEPKPEGTVVAVGPGRSVDSGGQTVTVPVGIPVGQKVIFSKYVGTPVKLDGADHILLREQDILALVEGEGRIELGAGS